jgi:NADPH:quinone reductase-like Zn-dependent oxidoreductase
MKAAVVRDQEKPPRYETFELPASGEGIVVDVLAAALSHRARSGATGKHYASNAKLPLVPGIDGVGRLPDGRRVYFLAADDAVGTMADKARADSRFVVPLPEDASASAVAAAMIPAISSWIALTKRVTLVRGQSVLVLGATGTSGRLAVQIAKRFGAARVVAVGRDDRALAELGALGADDVVRWSGENEEDVARAASEVDVVIDYLWGAVTMKIMPALCRRREDESRALDWILVGSVAGDEIALSSVLLRKRNLRVLGSGQGAVSTADMFSAAPAIVAALSSGELRVRVREVPLAEIERHWSESAHARERIVFVP